MAHIKINGKDVSEEIRNHITKEVYVKDFLKTESLAEYLHQNKSPQFVGSLWKSDEPILKTLLNKENMTYEDLVRENKDNPQARVMNREIHALLKDELYKDCDVDSIFKYASNNPMEEVLSYASRNAETHQKFSSTLDSYFTQESGRMTCSVYLNSSLMKNLEQNAYLFNAIRSEVDSIRNPNYKAIDRFMIEQLQKDEVRQACHNEFLGNGMCQDIKSEFRTMYEKTALNQKLEEKLVKEQPVIKKTIRQREQEEGFTMKI